mgnify:FL=1
MDHRNADLDPGTKPPVDSWKQILWNGDWSDELSDARILENLFLVGAGIRHSSMFHPMDEDEVLKVRDAAEKIGSGMIVRKAGRRVLKVFIFDDKKREMAESIPDIYEDMGFRDFIIGQITIARMTGYFLDFPPCCVESFVNHLNNATDQDLFATKALREESDPDPDAYFMERFVPCSPRCENAIREGRRITWELNRVDPGLVELYGDLKRDHMKDVADGVILEEKKKRGKDP